MFIEVIVVGRISDVGGVITHKFFPFSLQRIPASVAGVGVALVVEYDGVGRRPVVVVVCKCNI